MSGFITLPNGQVVPSLQEPLLKSGWNATGDRFLDVVIEDLLKGGWSDAARAAALAARIAHGQGGNAKQAAAVAKSMIAKGHSVEDSIHHAVLIATGKESAGQAKAQSAVKKGAGQPKKEANFTKETQHTHEGLSDVYGRHGESTRDFSEDPGAGALAAMHSQWLDANAGPDGLPDPINKKNEDYVNSVMPPEMGKGGYSQGNLHIATAPWSEHEEASDDGVGVDSTNGKVYTFNSDSHPQHVDTLTGEREHDKAVLAKHWGNVEAKVRKV